MPFLNSQLQARTVQMILLLKKWLVNNAYKTAKIESYGDSACECMYNKIVLATKYIDIMECYTFADDKNSDPYNCLTEDELRMVIEKSKKITISN